MANRLRDNPGGPGVSSRSMRMILLLLATVGCLSHTRPRAVEPVEPADPIVGELGCAPPMSLIDALYRPANAPTAPCAD